MDALFGTQVLRIEQPRRMPAAQSRYTISDGNGTLLAKASEQDVRLTRQATRALLGQGDDRRVVHLENAHGVPLLVLEKPKITHRPYGTWVSGPNGAPIGSVQPTQKSFVYSLRNAADAEVGRLDGNRLGRKFEMRDAYGTHVAQIDKRWKGAATELLTTADRYSVEIFRPLPDPLHILAVAAPLAIDLMLYEGKDWPDFS
ncbi:phospholipid scramblase-related protein [Spirillospora sp. CA-294931]|uniref:phospholipid scramblase-related protein n=1 Tax=Spirillospora sp. CA-294931 TaxID=3240042 RepID=UPI003D9153B0